jgi:hypothetical protein
VAIAVLCLAVPIALARVPPILDYSNHLARMWLLAGGVDRPPMSHIYTVDWNATHTNIFIDLAAASLGRLIPIFTLGRLLVLLALVGPPLGAIALHRSLVGRFHWWQAAFPLLAFSQTMLAGFLNFQIGLGLALGAAAADRWLNRRGLAAALLGRAAFGAALYCAHAFALFFYVVLLISLEIGPVLQPLLNPPALWRKLGRGLLAAVAACAPAPLMTLGAQSVPATHAIIWPDTMLERVKAAAAALTSYNLKLDALFALALLIPILAAALRFGRVHFALFMTGAALLTFAFLSPASVAGTWWIAPRFSVMAMLLLACSARPDLPKIPAGALAAGLALCVAAKSAWIGDIWFQRQSDVRSVEQALTAVPAGAAILVAQNVNGMREEPVGRQTLMGAGYWHFTALATPERQAFVPTLFAAAGMQPLRVLPPWSEIALSAGAPPSVDRLDPHARDPYPGPPVPAPYLRDWSDRFDYLVVINADVPNKYGPMPALANISLISDRGFARIYRIKRPSVAAPTP